MARGISKEGRVLDSAKSDSKCLWCGKALSYLCDTVIESVKLPCPKECAKCRHLGRVVTDFTRSNGRWTCDSNYHDCGPETRRKVVSRTRRAAEPGPYADGFFCSQNHGHRFGVISARAGFRRTKR
jgi:hypothetical protein